MDMKVYFHEFSSRQKIRNLNNDAPKVGITEAEKELLPHNKVNRGATLLTFDPRTGFCDYIIMGKAYVVVGSGDYPLSSHQVWGIQDLISEARDIYHCDPEHSQRGSKELLRWCHEYRRGNYGPLAIYEPRAEPWKEYLDSLSVITVVPEDHNRRRRHGTTQVGHSDRKNGRDLFTDNDELVLGDISNNRRHSHRSSQEFRARASRVPWLHRSNNNLD
jgi:hypothetical protein